MMLSQILIKSTFVAALGGLLFGFDTAVIAGTTELLRKTYGLSEMSLGFTVQWRPEFPAIAWDAGPAC